MLVSCLPFVCEGGNAQLLETGDGASVAPHDMLKLDDRLGS